jgi:lysyl-tRNA synthetase class 1
MTKYAVSWGIQAPEHFSYELFLDENGQKISKTSGNGVSIDEWLSYASTESLSYFMYLKPKTAKRMHFDVIPKAVDEYHQQLRAYEGQDDKARLNNPVWHIHGGDVPVSKMVVPFSMLLNLASVSGAEDKDQLWGFIKRYAPEASAETHADLDAAAGFAVRYYNDFVKPCQSVPRANGSRTRGFDSAARRVEDLGSRVGRGCAAIFGFRLWTRAV